MHSDYQNLQHDLLNVQLPEEHGLTVVSSLSDVANCAERVSEICSNWKHVIKMCSSGSPNSQQVENIVDAIRNVDA